MSRNIEDNSDTNDYSYNQELTINDEITDQQDKKQDILHDAIYKSVLEIKIYIEENSLTLLEHLDYVDLINYVEDLIY